MKLKNLGSLLCCSISYLLFMLMGDRSSNKAADCRILPTPAAVSLTSRKELGGYRPWLWIPRRHCGSCSSSPGCKVSFSHLCFMFVVHYPTYLRYMAVFVFVCVPPQCPCRLTRTIMNMHMGTLRFWTAQPQRASKVDMSPTPRWKLKQLTTIVFFMQDV